MTSSRDVIYSLDELLRIDPETISLIISGEVPALVTSSGTVEMSRDAADTMFLSSIPLNDSRSTIAALYSTFSF